MTAYMLEMISVEKVVSSVKRFSNLSAKELPFDLEEAMLLWINKVGADAFDPIVGLDCCFPPPPAASLVFTGDHENEGDPGQRAEAEAPPAGLAQPPEGEPPACLTRSSGVLVFVFATYLNCTFP